MTSPGEWDRAMLCEGFSLTQTWPANLSQREVRLMAQWNADNLYLCVQSRIYPSGRRLDASVRPGVRGGDILKDDILEMGFWPSDLQPGKIQEGYHYFYALMNTAGARIGSRHKQFFESVEWPGVAMIRMANGITAEWWTAELAIPAKAIGLDTFANGTTYGFSVTRTFQHPMTWTSWSSTHSPVWTLFSDTLPAARISNLTSLLTGKAALGVELVGGKEASEVRYSVVAQKQKDIQAETVVNAVGTLMVPKDGSAKLPVPPATFTHDPEFNQYSVSLTAGGGEPVVIYSAEHPFLAWDPKTEAMYNIKLFEKGLGFRYSPYPSTRAFWGRADVMGTPYEKDVAAAEFAVRFGGKELGRARTETIVGGYLDVRVPVADVAAGQYELVMTVLDKAGKALETKPKQWTREILPWEGNKAGLDEILIPPYTPMQVKGQTLGCLLRDYELGGLGLPAQVTAMDEPLLAGPIRFFAGADPDALSDVPLAAPVKITGARDSFVEFTAEGAAQGLTFRAKARYEFDGYSWYDVEIAPAGDTPATLSGLGLRIPFKGSIAKLYNTSTRGSGRNVMGAIPDGTGKVWESNMADPLRTYGDTALPLPYYLWIGDPDRGLAFYFESDQAWKRLPELSTHQMVRDPATGTLDLLVRMIQYPVTVDRPFTLSFGFMATPVRPVLGFHPRSVTDRFPQDQLRFPRSVTLCPPIPLWGKSYTLVPDIRLGWDKLTEALQKELAGRYQMPSNAMFGVIGPYTDRDTAPWLEPGVLRKTFRGEWSRFSLGGPYEDIPYIEGMKPDVDATNLEAMAENGSLGCALSQSYIDMRLHYHALVLSNCPPYGGCYFDNLGFGDIGQDPELPGHGHFLPDGRWQGHWLMRLHRQLLKRYAVAAVMNGKPVISSCNGVGVPMYASLLQWGLCGEGMSGDVGDYLEEPGLDVMQILCSKQWGCDSFCLVQVRDKRAKDGWYRDGVDLLPWRNAYGTLMIHAMPSAHGDWYEQARSTDMALAPFRGTNDTEFIPYWRNAPYLLKQDPEALVSLYVRQADSKNPKRLLIIALNTRKEPAMREVAFTLNLRALGVDPAKVKKAVDPQRPVMTLLQHYPLIFEPVFFDRTTGEVKFDCRGHDYRTAVLEY
jgi:hypothetical protein